MSEPQCVVGFEVTPNSSLDSSKSWYVKAPMASQLSLQLRGGASPPVTSDDPACDDYSDECTDDYSDDDCDDAWEDEPPHAHGVTVPQPRWVPQRPLPCAP